MSVITHLFVYYLFRLLLLPFQFLPYQILKWKAWTLGSLAYYLLPHYRRRAENNLAFAKTLHPPKDTIRQSFINLVMTSLEYAYFYLRPDRIKKRINIINSEPVEQLIKEGTPIVFFSGHQANWELSLFSAALLYKKYSRDLIAVGRPIKNRFLYGWIIRFREASGAKIVTPKELFKKGGITLRKGGGIGIVGDQALLTSGYMFPLFGSRAWSTTAPALLAYQYKAPLVCGFTHRITDGLELVFTDPLYPDPSLRLKEGVPRLMDQCLSLFEKDVGHWPGQWLWLHNRWKQKRAHTLPRAYQVDSILIILPDNAESWFPYFYKGFRTLYPYAFCTLLVPNGAKIECPDVTQHTYHTLQERCLKEGTLQMVFDFLECKKTQKYYLKQNVRKVLTLKALSTLAKREFSLEECPSQAEELLLAAFGQK